MGEFAYCWFDDEDYGEETIGLDGLYYIFGMLLIPLLLLYWSARDGLPKPGNCQK